MFWMRKKKTFFDYTLLSGGLYYLVIKGHGEIWLNACKMITYPIYIELSNLFNIPWKISVHFLLYIMAHKILSIFRHYNDTPSYKAILCNLYFIVE